MQAGQQLAAAPPRTSFYDEVRQLRFVTNALGAVTEIEPRTPTMAQMMPRFLDAGSASRLGMLRKAKESSRTSTEQPNDLPASWRWFPLP
jgi:hypothetical protein